MKLYEIAAEYHQAADILRDMDVDEQTAIDTLDSIKGELEDKCKNVAAVVREMEFGILAMKEAESGISKRREILENRMASFKGYLKHHMEQSGVLKIESPYFTLSIKKNPPSVDIVDESKLPSEFMIVPPPPAPRPDKKRILSDLRAGNEVPGAYLRQGTRLDIK